MLHNTAAMFFKRKTSPPPAAAAASSSVTRDFEQALALHQQGRLPEATALYEAVLARQPAHFDALHMRGVIAAQGGDPARAVELIGKALEVDGRQAQAHYHRALALRELNRPQEALAGFERVLAQDAGHADALLGRAELLQALGRAPEALAGYERALAVQPDNAQAWFAQGVLLQHLREQARSLDAYAQVLRLQPDFPGAVHNRALALEALGRHAEALDGYDTLVRLLPGHAPGHVARGRVLTALQRNAEALAAYERALTLQPDLGDARFERARTLRALGQAQAARPAFEAHLAAAPDHAEGWFELAGLLRELRAEQAAVAAYQRALALREDFAEARINLALTLRALKQFDAALAAIDAAIALRPDVAEAWHNRGVILGELKRHEEALTAHERALALRPDYVGALAGRAHEFEMLRRLPDAITDYDRALQLEPDNVELHYGRGAALQMLERHEESLACYQRTLALAPAHAAALSNMAGALRTLGRPTQAAETYGRLLEIAPDHPYALGNRLHAQLHGCDWSGYAARESVLAGVAAGKLVDTPFDLLALTSDAQAQLACARLHARDAHPPAAPIWRGERYSHSRLRIAYVSSDLSFHPVSYLMAGLLESHDRARFEVHAISLRKPQTSAFDARIRAAFERYTDVSALADQGIARLLREREIDIAVDLMGYTNLPRTGIYAHRPAPVHAAYLGYAGTLGTGYMDYLIADPVAIPPASFAHYAEQVVHLPASFMPRDTLLRIPAAPTRAAAGLPARGFVFCCFNNGYKINPAVFDVWMRLLKSVPQSVLWLSPPAAGAAQNLRVEAAARGVDPQRLVFAPKLPSIEEHLARSALADLFIDTLPYNAHTTASDALWAGVPLLTCAGQAFASRVAASLLSAAGLPELVTSGLADYEALALRLARDPAQLAQLRGRLAQRRAQGTLFNTKTLCGNLEAAYLRMHERAQQGLPPQAFSLP
jgi:predicted O-linked N-acetylglucosamine transferase (SPINDLY family)